MSFCSPEVDRLLYNVIQTYIKAEPVYTLVTRRDILELLRKVINVFRSEPVLLNLPSNIHVVGDLHGNFTDLLRIFQKVGYPPAANYLFLGDYVDRGNRSVEILLMLFALKLRYPQHIYLIRGNHENEHMSEYYGFRDEIETKYNYSMFFEFHRVFRELPLAALINKKIFCVHGGLSPEFTSFEDLLALEKPGEIEDPSIFLDFVWSDPREQEEDYKPSARRCGQYFGPKALEDFCQKTGVELVIRAHELCQHGYNFPFENTDNCLTVFSSSNYCERKNKAAIINVSRSLEVTMTQFEPLQNYDDPIRVILPQWLDYIIIEEMKVKMQEKEVFSEPNSEPDDERLKQSLEQAAVLLCD